MMMMRQADLDALLAREQYGSRKKKTGIECDLEKRPILDILRQTKKPASICVYDLKSCYDI